MLRQFYTAKLTLINTDVMKRDIKDTMCFKTWYDLTLNLPDKNFYWCCKTQRNEEQLAPTRFDADTLSLDYIINNPIIKKRKKELSTGIRSQECIDCWNNEDRSGTSFRTTYQNNKNNIDLTDIVSKDLTQKIEIILTNRCNSACVYCWAGLSSRWQKEVGEFFDDTQDEILNKSIEVLHEYWNTELHKRNEMTFCLLGGEPFFTNHMFYFIENFINKIKITNRVTVEITTGLNFTEKTFQKFIDLIKDNKNVHYKLIVSAEAIGDKFEYIRWGSNWNKWDINFDAACKHASELTNLTLKIGSAHNYLSLPYVKEFLEYIENKKIRIPIQMTTNWVEYPYELSINMIDKKYCDDIDDAIQYLKGMKTKIILKKELINSMQTMRSMVASDVSGIELQRRQDYLDKLQQRRNIDFNSVFKHLDKD